MGDNIKDFKHTKVATAQGRSFLNRRVIRRDAPQTVAPTTTAPDYKVQYETALKGAKPTMAAADRVLLAGAGGPALTQAADDYRDAKLEIAKDLKKKDFLSAATRIPATRTLAAQVLTAKGREDAAGQKKKQVAAQTDRFDAMAPAMDDVKRTYLNEGGAARIAKQKLAPSPEFDDFLTALGALEVSKAAYLKKAKNAPVAADVKADCQTVVSAAQTWLAAFRDMDDTAQAQKDTVSKKQICETNMVMARQLALAMDIDAAGRPTDTNTWDAETQIRVAGAMAAFSYEQGYQEATALKGAGASDSFWIKSKDIDAKTGEMKTKKRGDFIFKPTDGEEFPDGIKDKPGAGATKEALASSNAKLFAAQTGIDLGVPETSIVSVGQYAIDGGDPSGKPMIGSAQQHAGASTEFREMPPDILAKVKREDIHKIALVDIMSLSMDRHGGNVMVNDDDPNNPTLVPIDHGGSLPSRKDFPAVKTRMGGIQLGGFKAEVINTLLKVPAAYENFDDETLAKLELLDPAAMETGMKGQRDALGKVHPGLDPAGKVGDDSFHLAKRSMMFLKRAAKSLSPAEIQIALAAHGEALFDAPDDNTFNQLADRAIADQIPKKAAYLEIMTLSEDELTKVGSWLNENGWKVATEDGQNSAAELLIRDPVNALKIYKKHEANPNKITIPKPGAAPNPPTRTDKNVPDQNMQNAYLVAFPTQKKDATVDAWQKREFYWNELNKIKVGANTGMAAYQDAFAATGAKVRAASHTDALASLMAWELINKAENAAALASLDPADAGNLTLNEIILRALSRQTARLQTAAATTAGADIAPDDALRSSVGILFDETLEVTNALFDRPSADAFDKRADAIMTMMLAGRLAEAETAMRALNTDAVKFQLDELNTRTIDIIDRLTILVKTVVLPKLREFSNGDEALYLADLAKHRGDALQRKDIGKAKEWLKNMTDIEKAVRAQATPKPATGNAPNAAQPQPVAGNQPGQQGIQDADADDDMTDAEDDDDTVPANPLGTFAFSQKAASAAKKLAVTGKLFKDKDTGMTSALKSVMTARKSIAGMKDTLAAPKKIAALEKAVLAHNKFGLFIASKLRLLSRNAAWQAYCDSAADLVQKEVTALQARIAVIKTGGGN